MCGDRTMTPEQELHHAEMLVRSYGNSIKYMKGRKNDVTQLEKALAETKASVTKLKKQVKDSASK